MTREEVARKAAKWWRDAYMKPRFDNGDSSEAGGMAMLMAMLLADVVPPEIGDRFEEALYQKILDEYEGHDYLNINVDYAPDHILGHACEVSGMSPNNSPWKTRMNIRDGVIKVAAGYGAGYVEI